MIEVIIKQWEENKNKLEEYFRTTKQSDYSSYKEIVRAIFEKCIPENGDYNGWNLDKMTIIDDGDYQGTQIFLIPKDQYQPEACDYVITDTYYGSCSGCDTLLRIREELGDSYDDLPTEAQVKQYMLLALHLVQKMHWLSKNEAEIEVAQRKDSKYNKMAELLLRIYQLPLNSTISQEIDSDIQNLLAEIEEN